MYDDVEIGIHCPGCDYEIVVTLGQIHRREKIACPGCGSEIAMKPDEP
ncbi:MAG: phage terminase large subunit family protein [Dehalococcoidia bacterium]|nr:phage terminase large subunit family protein [Dehalococcoidia bacterium]